MKKYHVQFFYHSDLRCEWMGESRDEVSALAAAMYHHKMGDWVVEGGGFEIKISLAS